MSQFMARYPFARAFSFKPCHIVSIHGVALQLPHSDPREVRLLFLEVAGHGIAEHLKGRLAVEPAGLPEGEDALHPAVSLFRLGPEAPFSPEDRIADHSFGKVVGRVHPFLVEKHPQALDFLFQTTGEAPRRILFASIPVLPDHLAQSSVPSPPLAHGGGILGHTHQPAELILGMTAAGRDLRIGVFAEPLGLPNEVGQALLPHADPVLVHAVIVTDQDAAPQADELLKGLLGAVGVHHEKGDHRVGHDPDPGQIPFPLPSGLVVVVDAGVPGALPNPLIVRHDGLRSTTFWMAPVLMEKPSTEAQKL